jgi:putative transposase
MPVFDRGYTDHNWWLQLTRRKVQFVTRLKDSAEYGIVEARSVPEAGGILRDEVIVLCSQQDVGPAARLRRIEIHVEEKNETMVFVANNMKLAASTVAAIYKERWQIELFRPQAKP